MALNRIARAMGLLAVAMWLALPGAAQNPQTFKGRLSVVPIDATMRAEYTGAGSASAVLSGMKLTVSGSFAGLHTPATAARLGLGTVTGVTGSILAELTVTKAVSGTIAGSLDLTAEQVESLRKGKFYVQVYSERAPTGNLRAWLLR
jgi:hypothetical protein